METVMEVFAWNPEPGIITCERYADLANTAYPLVYLYAIYSTAA